MQITEADLLCKIGALVIENDALRITNERIVAEVHEKAEHIQRLIQELEARDG
jgi:hypothetical protein